ncbi:putative NADH dehydrogenase [ubiquinone] 1 alpha subcomplex subunit 12 [Amphibalanus amphitrite]|uniref:NADH dehydrogenase [ubiquinone] 1 alpha subcomplex subunit 12 n=2 Tax=Amphibalanus amphitrite TaxID=1232801 RepID=A0A6A4WWZ8_AMPAM|nr:putative NADH dehydrogenase [ubiquinone] 1 alpha subcomplex subunit 12 [Amphibalanus amphitrite]
MLKIDTSFLEVKPVIMAKLVGLDKVARIFQILKSNGGIRASLYKLYRFDDLKLGTHVGTDKYGNKYFENNMYFVGRNRWVEYAPAVGTDYDGSMVPAEWFGWLHYKTDETPIQKPPVRYAWQRDHEANPSGTADAYYPYSTTRPKVEAWVPPKK